MAYDYFELDRQRKDSGNTQRRWICHQCRRQFAYANDPEYAATPFAMPPSHQWQRCPVCQSPEVEQVTYTGVYDYGTPEEDIAKVLILTEQERIADAERLQQRRDLLLATNAEQMTSLAAVVEPADGEPEWPPKWTRGFE